MQHEFWRHVKPLESCQMHKIICAFCCASHYRKLCSWLLTSDDQVSILYRLHSQCSKSAVRLQASLHSMNACKRRLFIDCQRLLLPLPASLQYSTLWSSACKALQSVSWIYHWMIVYQSTCHPLYEIGTDRSVSKVCTHKASNDALYLLMCLSRFFKRWLISKLR